MPIPLPKLDDRTFADLVSEAHALIPSLAPEWTNRNESDPGITLIELFAYFSELLIYRLDRVTDANVCAFLRLIDGVERVPIQDGRGRICRLADEEAVNVHEQVRSGLLRLRQERTVTSDDLERLAKDANAKAATAKVSLIDEVRTVVRKMRQQDRAITAEDFERLALAADGKVKRARCLSQRNLELDPSAGRAEIAEGHISVIIVPADNLPAARGTAGSPLPRSPSRETVTRYLDSRRLLTTRVHVVEPNFLWIAVRLALYLEPDAVRESVRTKAEEVLQKFFDPLRGGEDGGGWPFGRNVYVSEIYALLDQIPGVEYVTKATDPATKQASPELSVMGGNTDRAIPGGDGMKGIRLEPDELVVFAVAESDLQLVDPKVDIAKSVRFS